ncbi:MAG: group 1 truncated hemoglobin [Candidatus Parcubacteria bacterium]|nr:group 1 truncated hemoglobin [Burkholderiales bacterium]
MKQSVFDRIGGEAALIAAVDLFYAKVLADPLTRPFFQALDMPAQSRKQVAFMAWALGGPAEYKGRNLRAAHSGLVAAGGLTDSHFDAVTAHLKATLEELGVAADLVAESLAIVGSTRSDVLNR